MRTALAFVERGECPAGIVYATDAAISEKVEVLEKFPPDTHRPIVYPSRWSGMPGPRRSLFSNTLKFRGSCGGIHTLWVHIAEVTLTH